MSSFWWSLLAGAIILLVDLTVTYGIVDFVVKRRERNRWRAAKLAILTRLKAFINSAFLMWSAFLIWETTGDQPGHSSNAPASEEDWAESVEVLRRHWIELRSRGDQVGKQYSANFWGRLMWGLGPLEGLLKQALDRADLALNDEPDILSVALDLEDKYFLIKGLAAGLADGGEGDITGSADLQVEMLGLELRLWDEMKRYGDMSPN